MGTFIFPIVATYHESTVLVQQVEGDLSSGTLKTFHFYVNFSPSRTKVVPYPVTGSFPPLYMAM